MNTKNIILSAAAFVAVSAAAQAGPSEAMALAIGQCASHADEKARLACYDEIAAQLKAGAFKFGAPQTSQAPAASAPVMQTQAAAVPPSPVSQSPAARASAPQSGTWYDPTSWFGKDNPETKSTNPADFGAEALARQRTAENAEPEPLNEIRANVTAIAVSPLGRFTVTLANGQVWKQIEGDNGTARFKVGSSVTISRGLLGSYNLVADGRSALFKVKRIQ